MSRFATKKFILVNGKRVLSDVVTKDRKTGYLLQNMMKNLRSLRLKLNADIEEAQRCEEQQYVSDKVKELMEKKKRFTVEFAGHVDNFMIQTNRMLRLKVEAEVTKDVHEAIEESRKLRASLSLQEHGKKIDEMTFTPNLW